jgi:hypothetical protein
VLTSAFFVLVYLGFLLAAQLGFRRKIVALFPGRGARAEAMVDDSSRFVDKFGNEIELGERLKVRLADGPFYADGPREEPLLDAAVLIQSLAEVGFAMLIWEPMLNRPNGLISDLYSKFVFRKKTR